MGRKDLYTEGSRQDLWKQYLKVSSHRERTRGAFRRKQAMCAIGQPMRNEGQSTGPVRVKALLPVLDLLSVTFQVVFL